MKPLERIARKINRMKEDPQDWAEFVTDFRVVTVSRSSHLPPGLLRRIMEKSQGTHASGPLKSGIRTSPPKSRSSRPPSTPPRPPDHIKKPPFGLLVPSVGRQMDNTATLYVPQARRRTITWNESKKPDFLATHPEVLKVHFRSAPFPLWLALIPEEGCPSEAPPRNAAS